MDGGEESVGSLFRISERFFVFSAAGVIVMQGRFPKRFGEEVAAHCGREVLTETLAIFEALDLAAPFPTLTS